MYSWPTFKQQVTACTDCRSRQFAEIPGGGLTSLFDSPEARSPYNTFIAPK